MDVHQRKNGRERSVHVTYDGRVYDVTEFLYKHPGGSSVLLKYADRDVTAVMKGPKPHEHSKAAFSILKSLPCPAAGDSGIARARQGGENLRHDEKDVTSQTDVDWSMPIASQVSKLGGHYFTWVHQPVEQDIRFFKSNLLEALTSCSWYVVPILWLPIMWYFVTCSMHELQRTNGEVWLPWLLGGVVISDRHVSSLFLAGILLWTFLEYTFHRWLFHFCPPADYPKLIMLHFLIHGQHHKSPMDKRRLVFPPAPASIVAGILWVSYRLVFSPAMTMAVFAGSIFGYVAYDLTHYYLHHGTPWLAYFRALKQYHMKHHFSYPDLGFGISSKLWDVVFRTKIPPD